VGRARHLRPLSNSHHLDRVGVRSSAPVRGRLRSCCAALIPVALFAMLATGCTGARAATAHHSAQAADVHSNTQAAATAAPSWMSYQRPPTSAFVTSDVRVPTRDGTELGCVLFRPATGTVPNAGRYPVIVSNFWPYYTSQDQWSSPAQNPNAQ